jgi:predicted nucleic acid-binding Zn ribbon protein
MQRFSDAPLTRHEACGGSVERLLSAPALQFKGSGWYITDYAKSGAGKSPENGTSKTETKSDSGSKSDSGTPGTSGTTSSPSSSPSADKK